MWCLVLWHGWYLFLSFCSFIADCQIPEACYSFVREHGVQMIKKNLSRNFLSHMVNLFDFSLIRPDVVHKTMQMLDEVDDSMHRSWEMFKWIFTCLSPYLLNIDSIRFSTIVGILIQDFYINLCSHGSVFLYISEFEGKSIS